MSIDKHVLSKMLTHCADLWRANADALSEIDSRFGDGDHGVTIGKIAKALANGVEKWGDESIHDFICGLGDSVMAVGGGSAGPLYGTLIGGLADPLTDETEIDAPLLKKMLAGGLEALCGITKARVGDKTMMDALIPAVESGQTAPDDVESVLLAAAEGAAAGMKATEKFPSKFGRARHYGDQTIGTPDAGALSVSLFFQGLSEGLSR